jgi:hypothetical protein
LATARRQEPFHAFVVGAVSAKLLNHSQVRMTTSTESEPHALLYEPN